MKINELVCKAINNKKNETIRVFNNLIEKSYNEENPVKLYYILTETFHNTMEQGEYQIELLKQFLSNDFFKDAAITNGVNNISFSNDDFEVLFSKCLNKRIQIKFKTPGAYHYNGFMVSERKIQLANLMEQFLGAKSFKNFKKIVEYSFRNGHNSLVNRASDYIKVYRKCNERFIDEVRKSERLYAEEEIRVRKKNKLYYKRQLYAKEFIENLTDLKKFKDEDWLVAVDGIEKDYLGSWRDE